MNGELAQLVVLAGRGRLALLADGEATIAGGPPVREALRWVRSLRFERADGSLAPGEAQPVTAVDGWLDDLRGRGATTIELCCPRSHPDAGSTPIRDAQAAAFANGGRWFVQVRWPDRAEAWWASWQVHPGERRPDAPIWDVTYRGTPLGAAVPVDRDPAGAARRLSADLVDAAEVAAAMGEPRWADHFERARARADAAVAGAPTTAPAEGGDLLPASRWTPQARATLAAAEGAWVFGGMGSWNDLVADDDAVARRYDEVSDRLFDAVLGAIEAAVNAPLDLS